MKNEASRKGHEYNLFGRLPQENVCHPAVLNTAVGRSAPGVTAGFKVYVITTTGNERGSNAVYVEHPTVA